MKVSNRLSLILAAAGALAGIGLAAAAVANADPETSAPAGIRSVSRGVHISAASPATPAPRAAVTSPGSGTAAVSTWKGAARADLRRVGLGAIAGVTQRSNYVVIAEAAAPGSPTPTASFTFTGDYSITGGQPWGGIYQQQCSSACQAGSYPQALQLEALAGRKGSSGPAQWFVSNGGYAIIGDDAASYSPSSLNFAFAGTLDIGNLGGGGITSYPVVIGQGNNATGNNWWIGGQEWQHAGCSGGSSPPVCRIISSDGLWVLSTYAVQSDGTLEFQPNVFTISEN